MTNPPAGWGDDHLSAFIDMARRNVFATFANCPGTYRRIKDIDELYLALFDEYSDPENALGAAFGMRCHSALRASAQLMLAGQIPEGYMVLRGALEHALYAHHASTSDERTQIWMNRGDNEASKKKSASEFSGRNFFPSLRERDQLTGQIVGDLYERCIELGAHPNAMGVTSTLTVGEHQNHYSFDFSYLTGDGLNLRLALKSWSQAAIVCLDIFGMVLSDRFVHLGLHERSLPMRHGI
jgi:hypothetical protein